MKLLVLPVLTLVSLTGFAQASDPIVPTQTGDYLSNVAHTMGTVRSGKLQAGYLWRVVSSRLNCREQADLNAKIVRQFTRGTVLQADLGRGGSDEVLQNAIDSNGKPWMRVRNATGQNYNCYVRANQKYIQPM